MGKAVYASDVTGECLAETRKSYIFFIHEICYDLSEQASVREQDISSAYFSGENPYVEKTLMSETTTRIFFYDTVDDGAHRYVVSPLPHRYGCVAGLPPEAVMGDLTNGPNHITPKSFQRDPQFLQFLGTALGKHAMTYQAWWQKPRGNRTGTSVV